MKKVAGYIVAGLMALGLLIQLVPYGRNHSDPPVVAEPPWDRPQTRTLAQRACFDCHSNETVWPCYSNVAPVSWLVYHDVVEGRQHINFSEWNRSEPQHTDEFQQVYDDSSMPPANYLLPHPAARLSVEERQHLFHGLSVLAAAYGH